MDNARFCIKCGRPVGVTDRFCGSCGAGVPNDPTNAAPAAAAGPAAASASGFGPALGRDRSSPGVDFWPPASDESAGWGRLGEPVAPAAFVAGMRESVARRGVTWERFARGDWTGALSAAAVGVVALLVVATLLMLVMGAPVDGAGQVLAASAMVVALAVGGTVDATSGALGAQATLTFQPLVLTGIGFTLIAAVFLYRLRRSQLRGFVDVVLQAVRVWVVLMGLLLVVSLIGRVKVSASDTSSGGLFSPGDHVATAVVPTLFFAGCWLAGALMLAVMWRTPWLLPARARRWRDMIAGPTAGVLTAVLVAGVVILVVLVVAYLMGSFGNAFNLGDSPGSSSSSLSAGVVVGVLLVFGPVVALANLPFFLGTPLSTGALMQLFGSTTGGTTSVTLFDATDTDLRLWVGPVVALLAVLLGGVVCALYAASPQQAQRTGWRMGVGLGVLFLLIALNTSAVFGGAVMVGNLNVNFHLSYVAAPFVGMVWGALGGWVGAQLAPRMPNSMIAAVRARAERARYQPEPQQPSNYPAPAPGPETAPGFDTGGHGGLLH